MVLFFVFWFQYDTMLESTQDPYIQHIFQQEHARVQVLQKQIPPALRPFLKHQGQSVQPRWVPISGLLFWFGLTWLVLVQSFRWKWIDEPVSSFKTGLMIPLLALTPLILWALMQKIFLPFNLAILLLLVFSHAIYTFFAAYHLKTSIENSALVMFLFVVFQVSLITGLRTYLINSSWF